MFLSTSKTLKRSTYALLIAYIIPVSICAYQKKVDEDLLMAAAQEDLGQVTRLLELGALPDASDDRGFTSLFFAAQLGNNDIAKVLIKHKANVNAVDNQNDTALKWATNKNRFNVVTTLLAHGAKVDAMDNDGNTALIDAAAQGYEKIVRLLIKHNANVNHQNNRGQTALTVAKAGNHKSVVKLLEEHNAQEGIANIDSHAVLIAKIRALPVPQETKNTLWKMALQLEDKSAHPNDIANTKGCLDMALSLPWGVFTPTTINLAQAKKILDEDHYGMDKVKEQILDFMATLNFNKNGKAPILCLVGAPGIGKTSIAQSIARALGRNYTRIAVGGMHDESQLRGHIRTYLSARPGRIILALKEAKCMNPVIVIDEIDKISSTNNYHGNPAAAMLEILDPEQNKAFRDNYLEVECDLSQVLFITTANNIEDIPRPLRDRMQIIHLPSYTAEEKLAIAQHHLLKKAIKDAGLEDKNIAISAAVLQKMIKEYSMEAGVRQTKRNISRLMAKIARGLLEKGKVIELTPQDLKKHLGKGIKDSTYKEERQVNEIGAVNGLAVMGSLGLGVTTKIEALVVPRAAHEPEVKATGLLQQMTQESIQRAYSYVRAHAAEFGISDTVFQQNSIHLNWSDKTFSPVDGPSAGIAEVTAIMSAITKRPVNCQYAMTGAINLRGDVLPIGGCKEKILGAKDNGLKYVIMPYENKVDVEELEDVENVTKGITVIYVKHVHEVLKLVLM